MKEITKWRIWFALLAVESTFLLARFCFTHIWHEGVIGAIGTVYALTRGRKRLKQAYQKESTKP